MSILSDHLTNLKGKRIIVVMCDNMAYFGRLQSFDESFLILNSVKEADYKKSPVWKEPKIRFSSAPMPSSGGKGIGLSDGLVDDKLTGKSLTTVIVNISHVVRVWGDL